MRSTTSTSGPSRFRSFVGATNLGEALRCIGEGAAMIRSKGEAGTGDIVNAVTHLRKLRTEIRWLEHPWVRRRSLPPPSTLQAPCSHLCARLPPTGAFR